MEPFQIFDIAKDDYWNIENEVVPEEQNYVSNEEESNFEQRIITESSNVIIDEELEKQPRIISEDEFKIGKMLGKGNTGRVFSGLMKQTKMSNEKEEEEEIAIKEIIPSRDEKIKDINESILVTTKSWCQLNHSNVILLKGICPREDKITLILMENGKGGTLSEFLDKIDFYIPDNIILLWGLKIARGMNHIHSKNIIHRDLKTENIVMTNNSTELDDMLNTELKIIDINDGNVIGTPQYMSPECMSKCFYPKSDVWSFAVILWELLTGEKPFAEIEETFTIFYSVGVKRCTLTIDEDLLWNDCRRSISDLIKKCWSYEQQDRPSFQEIETTLERLLTELEQDTSCNQSQSDDCEAQQDSDIDDEPQQDSDIGDEPQQDSDIGDEPQQFNNQENVEYNIPSQSLFF